MVDTVGSHKTFVDNYPTPHTEAAARRRALPADRRRQGAARSNVHVEDPGAFTTPWNAIQRYRKVTRGPFGEMVCAENNDDHFHHGLEPMPEADRPDF